MQVVDSCLYHSALALLLDCGFNLSSSLSDGFLYSRRMNTSVKYQLFKGHTRDFAPYRVKARKGYRFRCVIYYQINASVLEEILLWIAQLKGESDHDPQV